MATRNATPVRAEIWKKAESQDRVALMELVCPRTPLGTLRFADVQKVLAASKKDNKIPIAAWDKAVASRPDDGICKGFFLSSFRANHFSRRCDAAIEDGEYCRVCSRMRKKAEGEEAVGIEDEVAHEVVNIAVMSRLGVTRCIEKWDRESERLKKNAKLYAEFPYFKVKEVVRMIFGESTSFWKKRRTSLTSDRG